MIEAKIVLDSLSPEGTRLTTMRLTFNRFLLSELNTHRMFSRNTSSSRAIPIERIIKDIQDNPAMPVYWGKNKPGMQATEELSEEERRVAIVGWLAARDKAIQYARTLLELGVHKQLTNRILEPWQHSRTIVSATEWENFFNLRIHPAAQPEIQALARAMKKAMDNSTPQKLEYREWHIPFIYTEDSHLSVADKLKVSVARCARVSYKTFDGQTSTIDKDIELHDRLVGSEPMHASALEHQACAMYDIQMHKNFKSFRQYRSFLEHNDIVD